MRAVTAAAEVAGGSAIATDEGDATSGARVQPLDDRIGDFCMQNFKRKKRGKDLARNGIRLKKSIHRMQLFASTSRKVEEECQICDALP